VAERIRFYLDEHVDPAVSDALHRRGVNVLTAQQAGLRSANDRVHLRRAAREGRVIVTQDVDFLRLHGAGVRHAGIAYAPQHTPIGRIVRGLMLIHDALGPADMANHLEYL